MKTLPQPGRRKTVRISGQSKLIVVGPIPPPAHGVAAMTFLLIETLRAGDRLADHVDTSDRRPLQTVGRLDIANIWLAFRHIGQFSRALWRHRGCRVIVPISQGRWGFIRDATLLFATRLARRRCYVHLHGGHFRYFYANSGRPLRALIRTALKSVEQAWVLTPSLMDQFEGLIDPARVYVLENAVANQDNGVPSVGGDGHHSLKALYLGNVIPEKGCFDLLDALEHLGEAARDIQVRFVGEMGSSIEAALKSRGAALRGYGVSIDLPGPCPSDEKDRHYKWADVFVLPTRYAFEGQPLVLLEALAAGLPIVATRHAGIPDTVSDGINSLLVEPGDPRGLASALLTLRKDARLRRQLGRNARKRYEMRYQPERFQKDVLWLTSLPPSPTQS